MKRTINTHFCPDKTSNPDGFLPKSLSLARYAMKWLGWLLTYLLIWPAAMLMLLTIMLFRLSHTTPGAELAQEIAAVTHDVRSGEYRIIICHDKGPFSGVPNHSSASLPDKLPPADTVCREKESVVTDAKGYAAHINDALRIVPLLWMLMAAVFASLALFLGDRPGYRHPRDGNTRSSLFRYGRPAPATSPAQMDGSEQQDHHKPSF